MARITYPKTARKEARALRSSGASYKDISQRLAISKSTARLWCNDIVLSPIAHEKLYRAGVIKMTSGPNNARNRRLREIETINENAQKEISSSVSTETMKLLGAMLYWAEGDKANHFAIANSDPLLIAFMVNWWRHVFNVDGSALIAHLNAYPQQDEKKLKEFWSELTGIPLANFGKTFIKPLNKKYKKNNLYYGTIKIRMKNGSDSRHRTFGWIKKLLKDLNIETSIIETRWNKLKTDYPRG
jgi:hypothetical protein